MLGDVLRRQALERVGLDLDVARGRGDVGLKILAEAGCLFVHPPQLFLLVGGELDAVAAEVATDLGEELLALAREGVALGGVGVDHPRELGVEVEAREERVGLGLAELGGLAHGGVGVGDGGELVELTRGVDLEDHVVEAADHRVVGERRGRRALGRRLVGERG